MQRSKYRGRTQLVLELKRPSPRAPVTRSLDGLVEALADLLMAALGAHELLTRTGGADEHQDHA